MSTAKRLFLIALGYAFAVVGGFAAVALNELRISPDIQQTSGGMVAFGDVVLFLLVTGFLALAPSWFLLTLAAKKSPRTLVTLELLAAAAGPLSWLSVIAMASGPRASGPALLLAQLLGPFVAFGAIPRMILGPVLVVIEAITFILVRGRAERALLAAAMLMDLVPIGLFAAHMALAPHY